MPSQNQYNYKSITPIGTFAQSVWPVKETDVFDYIILLKNKLDETLMELNRVNKRLELYSKAYKDHITHHGDDREHRDKRWEKDLYDM